MEPLTYELSNNQRLYFGLDLIQSNWEKIYLKKGPYQPASKLYFEGNVLRKQIISIDNRYFERSLNLNTRNREYLLPKTIKGKETKITAAVLEKKKPDGISFEWTVGGKVFITNHNTEVNYYSTLNESVIIRTGEKLNEWVNQYVKNSSASYLEEIRQFKNSVRKNVNYQGGDFFAFKINRKEFGFGRILLDVHKLRKKKLIHKEHGLQLLMGHPVIINIYAYSSDRLNIDIDELLNYRTLPSDIIMDNQLFYGEYQIIGNLPLKLEEYEFPISFGRSLDFTRKINFLQWGLIHVEKPLGSFCKAINNVGIDNPHGYYGTGFYHRYNSNDIKRTISKGKYDFKSDHYLDKFDLRNPVNDKIRKEILNHFGLNSEMSYLENCRKLGVEPSIVV